MAERAEVTGRFFTLREKNAVVIGGIFCGDKRDILAQSAAWNRIRPDVESNMLHLIESYPIGEDISDETMLLRAEEKLKRLGLKDCPFLLVKHTDKAHAHAHLLISRIRSDGSIIDDSNIALRSIAVTKELDAEFGMHQTPFYFRAERVSRKEYEMMKRTGEDSQNQILRNIIEKAAQTSEKSFEKFLTNLKQEKVGFWLYLDEEQTSVIGIAFDCQRTEHLRGISGSRLGKGFGFPTLSKQIGYDKEKDFPRLIDKYPLKPKSEIQPATGKSKLGEKEMYVLVSHPLSDLIESDDKSGSVSEKDFDNAASVAAKSLISVPSREPIAEVQIQVPKIEENGFEKFDEALEPRDVLIKGREARLFYKKDGEDAGTGAASGNLRATARLVKSLQNKIDWAQDSAESFSEFLQNLQSKKIVCLPEIDDDQRVFDFIFIKKGIAVSSGELEEDYKFQALAKKLDYPDKPIYAAPQVEDPNSFQAQAAALRDKPLSAYWWKMKAETNDQGRVTINPATFEFLRVAYKETFETEVANLEISFDKAETADRLVQTLVYKEEHSIYRESISSISKVIAEGRQKLGNGTLILSAEEESVPRQTNHFLLNSPFLNENLIEQTQPDETYAEFQSIFKQASLEKILELRSGTAELETVGNSSARYQIVFSADEIKFFDLKDSDNKIDHTVKNRIMTFKRDEAGSYQPAASFVLPDDLYPEAAARYVKKDATEKISLLKTSEFGKNIIVTRLNIENDSRAEIEESNRANLEKYISRQLGAELVAEIAVRTARYDETVLRDNVNDKRLKVAVDIGRGVETREVSRADLLREREAIARDRVNNARKQGDLEGMVEDERISIDTAEKRQYRREMIKTEAMQKPWIDALEKAIAGETTRLEEVTVQAARQLKAEKAETDSIIKQTRIEDFKQIKPILRAERIWIEQIKAVKRFDTDTFVKLEEIHQASNLPRPNDVYARLRGMETVAKMNDRRENAALVERFGKEAAEQNIVINLRREGGELKLEAWQLKKNEQPLVPLIKENQIGNAEIKVEQTFYSINPPRSLTDKINPSLSAKTDLSWISDNNNPLNSKNNLSWTSDNKKPLNPYLNPISIIKNDKGLQIIRAVVGYSDQKNKNEQLADLTQKAVDAAQILGAGSTPEVADNAARMSQAVQTAVEREETMRENLRLDESFNTELLKTPECQLKPSEMKQIGVVATETGDVQKATEYYDLVKKVVGFADAIGETEESTSVQFFLTAARAAYQANNAIEQITPLKDGSINVELNPAQLTQAINSFKTADAVEEFQPAASENVIIKSLSLENIYQTEQLLTANNQISDPLNQQIFNIGSDLVKSLQPPLNQAEQEMARQWAFTQDFYNRLGQMNRSEHFLDKMAEQAETDSQNQIPFQQTARNFTLVNLSDKVETEKVKYWEDERQQRDAKIARENAQKRSAMTDSERAEQDAIAHDEAAKDELAEKQREDWVLLL